MGNRQSNQAWVPEGGQHDGPSRSEHSWIISGKAVPGLSRTAASYKFRRFKLGSLETSRWQLGKTFGHWFTTDGWPRRQQKAH